MANLPNACPCGSSKPYSDCCGVYVTGAQHAPTALALMRSRYTAFTQRNEQYLSETWHESTRPAHLDLNDKAPIKWLSLTVVETKLGGVDDNEGTVEFIALFKVNGKADRLHERSRFRKENGRWYYLDGEMRDVVKKTKR